MIYQDQDLARKVGEDPQNAAIPELHKAMFRYTEKFVKAPWTFTREDLDELRELGLDDADIVLWAQIAALQTWFTMSADGSGIPLESDATAGPVLGNQRENYSQSEAYVATGSLASVEEVVDERSPDCAWVAVTQPPAETRTWAMARYGFVPNLLKAVSLEPGMMARHHLALELIDRPQSITLPESLHRLARGRASLLNRSTYSSATAEALIDDPERLERLGAEAVDDGWSNRERAVLTLATKLVRHSYKITGGDAEAFRKAGLDDAAYVDVLNTVAIQTSLDRMAAALGVQPDPKPLIVA